MVTTLLGNILEEKRKQATSLMWMQNLLKDPGNDIIKIRKEVDKALKQAAEDFEKQKILGGKKHDK